MVRYDLTLLRDIPAVFRGTAEGYLFWIGTVGLPLLLYFAPRLKPMTENNPWLIGVPIALGVIYGMMRVNYLRFTKLHGDFASLSRRLDDTQPEYDDVERCIKPIPVEGASLPKQFMVAVGFAIPPTRRKASEVGGQFVFTTADLLNPPAINVLLDNGYGESRTLGFAPSITFPKNYPVSFIAVRLSYLDKASGERLSQYWYWKWEGSDKDGFFSNQFDNMSKSETDRFLLYLKSVKEWR